MTDHAKTLADALHQIHEECGGGNSNPDVWRIVEICNNALSRSSQTDIDWESRFKEEHAIVDRIWKMLGVTDYASAKGKSIYELLEERFLPNTEMVERMTKAVRNLHNPLGNPTHGYHCGFLSGKEEALREILRVIKEK